MMAEVRRLLWLLPLCVIASIAASLPAVWLVSKALGFTFDAALVAALSGAVSASIVSVRIWTCRGVKREHMPCL